MRVLEFARSTILFRIDLDILAPRTLSHKPPFQMNNARVQIDGICRVTERASGRAHTFVLGGDCKTERVGATSDLFLDPNADFIPIFSDDAFMHIKTFARAGTRAQAYPPGSGETRFVPMQARRGDYALFFRKASVEITFENERYLTEIEYPVKTINANERDIVYQTDTGPILLPDLDREPDDLLAGLELAFTAANAPDWAQLVVRARTPIADGVEVYHYGRSIRVDDIANEFYRIPDDTPATRRRVDLLAVRGGLS